MRLLIILLLVSSIAQGQSTYYIRADTIRFQKVGGNTTFFLENSTRAKQGAYLRNYNGGRTDFYYAVDSASISGTSLVLWRGLGTQNVTVSLSGIGGNTNSNIGSGYRLAVPNTNNIKTLGQKYGIILDSATSNEIGIKFDSATVFPQIRATITSTPPAGNYGNVQLNRNGAFATPATDSLDFDAGLSIKGDLKVTNVPSGAVTDSAVILNTATGQFRKKPAVVVNTSGRADGDCLIWDAGANEYISVPCPGGSNIIGWLRFITGVTANSVDPGDSILTNTFLIDKRIKVHRDHEVEDSGGVYGFEFDPSIGEVIFHPALSDSESVFIEVYALTAIYDIALEVIPCSPGDIDFDLADGGVVESPANTWTIPNNERVSHSTTSLTADGYFECQMPGQSMVIGLDATSGLEFYDSGGNTFAYNYGFFTFAGDMYVVQVGESLLTPTNIGAVGSNTHVRLTRTGTTVKAQVSTDGTNFTDAHTYSVTTAIALFAKASNGSGSNKTVINPKTCGFE